MIVREDSYAFDQIPVANYRDNLIKTYVDLDVQPNGNAAGELQVFWKGESNGMIRTMLAHIKPELLIRTKKTAFS